MIQYACNLSCRGCITMTDYNRKGSVSIVEGEVWLREWSQVLDVGTICLFGGEPTMNKDLITWIKKTRQYFPSSKIKIISNGTYLKHKNILSTLVDVGNIEYQISLHWRSGDKFDLIKQELIKQLTNTGEWKLGKSDRAEVIMLFNQDTTTVQLAVFGEFIIPYKNYGHTMKPWASDDIASSYSNCGSPLNPILYKNKIYKCGPIANLRDTLELHELLQDSDWQAYLDYSGFSTNDINEMIADFGKPNAICSMCSKDKAPAAIDHYADNAVVEKKTIKWH